MYRTKLGRHQKVLKPGYHRSVTAVVYRVLRVQVNVQVVFTAEIPNSPRSERAVFWAQPSDNANAQTISAGNFMDPPAGFALKRT